MLLFSPGGRILEYAPTMNPFKKKVTSKDVLRNSIREMTVATSDIEREIASLLLEEEKLVAEMKQTAKTRNKADVKILAHHLIRLRKQISNLLGSRAQIRDVAIHRNVLLASTSAFAAMEGAIKAMDATNKEMEPAKRAKIMKEFHKQSTQMDMTREMMSKAIDETLDKVEVEEETEELTNQLSSAPKGRIAVNSKKVDNIARLNRLAILLLADIFSIIVLARDNVTLFTLIALSILLSIATIVFFIL